MSRGPAVLPRSAGSFEVEHAHCDAGPAAGPFEVESAATQARPRKGGAKPKTRASKKKRGEASNLAFEVETGSLKLGQAVPMDSFEIEDTEDSELDAPMQEPAEAVDPTSDDANAAAETIKTAVKKDEKKEKKEKPKDKEKDKAKEKDKKKKKKKKKNKKKDEAKAVKDTSQAESSGTDEFANPISDAWPKDGDGNLKLSHRRGREMCESVAELYTHLRETSIRDPTVKDTYGLWMHIVDSEDEDEDEDEHVEASHGTVHFDRHFLKKARMTKDTKEALRLNNPAQMTEKELEEALKRRGLSTKGGRASMADRLTEAFNTEAQKMHSVGPIVTHFNSATTKRNLEMLISKINTRRHGDLQVKLKTAHTDIEENLMKLQKMQDIVNKQAAELMDRDAMISSLNSKISGLSDRLSALGEVANTVAGGAGTGLLGHTIGAFAKDRGSTSLVPWSVDKIADTLALSSDCTILIIDKSTGFGWERAFLSRKIKTKDGRTCRVYHTAWHLVNISSTSHFGGRAVVDVLQSDGAVRIIPDVALVLDPCRAVHGEDHTHQLQALLHSGTPCLNSAESMLQCADRPVVYAALMGIRNRLGVDKQGDFNFPLVHQDFFANEAPGGISPSFPMVTKLSSVHSGFGKMRCMDNSMYNELVGVVALSTDYYTTEDLLEGIVAEVYILQIGKTLRAYRKAKDMHFRTWNEWGDATQYEDIPMTSDYKSWASQVQPLFGGLDIFAINVLQVEGGKEFIIGIHDVGCGLADQHANEDAMLIIDMVLKKVDERRKELKNYAKFG